MRRLWVLGLLLGLAGVALAAPDEPKQERSLVLMPEQSIPLNFDHKRHLDQGLQCIVCHSAANDSTEATDSLIPNHTQCGLCHRMEQPNAAEMFPKAACSTCHSGFEGQPSQIGPPPHYVVTEGPRPPPVHIPPARITFSHSKHLAQGVPCLQCHEGVDETQLATREHLPTMRTCLECHTGGEAPSECTTCHLQGDGGRLRTSFEGEVIQPKGRFRPDDHGDPRWLKIHQSAARVDTNSCESCHATQFCLNCHDGVVEDTRLHPADWVLTHGLEAQRRTVDCFACHEVQADCTSCHTAAEVVPGAFPGVRGEAEATSRFHPPGWAGVPGEIPPADHHSFQARRALETCEACHSVDLCNECHSVLVNPHPDSYGTEGNWRFGQGDGTMCLQCHRPGDPNLSRLGR